MISDDYNCKIGQTMHSFLNRELPLCVMRKAIMQSTRVRLRAKQSDARRQVLRSDGNIIRQLSTLWSPIKANGHQSV